MEKSDRKLDKCGGFIMFLKCEFDAGKIFECGRYTKYAFIGVLGVCKKVTKYVKLFCK